MSIYLCETEYLCHFSGDSRIEKKKSHANFIKNAIDCLEHNKDIAVVNPIWNYQYLSVKLEAFSRRGKMSISHGFSDQCYLVRTSEFRGKIYNEKNPASERYPKYGGNLFEKRLDAYMRNHDRLRATYLKQSYYSRNIRKDTSEKQLKYSLKREIWMCIRDLKMVIKAVKAKDKRKYYNK